MSYFKHFKEILKEEIRSRKWKARKHNDQKFEDTKGVIRSRKWKDRQFDGQKKNDKNVWLIFT